MLDILFHSFSFDGERAPPAASTGGKGDNFLGARVRTQNAACLEIVCPCYRFPQSAKARPGANI